MRPVPAPRSAAAEGAYLAIPLLVCAAYLVQMYSLHLSGNFITALALENRAEAWIIRGRGMALAIALMACWWLLFVLGHFHARGAAHPAPPTKGRRLRLAAVTAFGLGVACSFLAQPDTGLLQADYRQAPLVALAHTLRAAVGDHYAYHGPEISAHGPKYPLEKHWIYSAGLPFARKPGQHAAPNVIVVFMEGTSARLLGAYGGTYPGLTPNMDRFAGLSMRVVRYYNHTAATYRGLQGQLVSGYPEAGGSEDGASWESAAARPALAAVHYRSLPMLLRDHGYGTFFLSPHHDTVGLNTMLRALGFDRVYSFDDVARDIAPGSPYYFVEGALSDDDLFHALHVLMERGSLSGGDRPFFVGLYNFGTHAFLDVMPNGAKYGDGSNAALNKLHNLDRAFGRFLDYFMASPYARDTILVLTTDHATFPEPPYRAVAGTGYQPYFVDAIPLLVYDPTHALPTLYDAHDRTSLDFAPTLLQLLGIRQGDNSFLGTSLFEARPDSVGVAAIGHEFFAIDADGVHPEADLPPADRPGFQAEKQRVLGYYRLEREDRIASPWRNFPSGSPGQP